MRYISLLIKLLYSFNGNTLISSIYVEATPNVELRKQVVFVSNPRSLTRNWQKKFTRNLSVSGLTFMVVRFHSHQTIERDVCRETTPFYFFISRNQLMHVCVWTRGQFRLSGRFHDYQTCQVTSDIIQLIQSDKWW